MYQMEGRSRSYPSRKHQRRNKTPKPRATDSIAPTEFPKTRSAVESLTGVAARNKPTAYTSQEEEAHTDSTRKRG